MASHHQSSHPADQLRKEVDKLLTSFTGGGGAGFWSQPGGGELPVNVWETRDALFVEVELPGTTTDQLQLSVVGNELTIKVNCPENRDNEVTYHRQERPVGAFSRVLRVPVAVDPDRVQADLRTGILTITLPKAETARPRKIKIISNG
jgi:HSP20 family protein